MWGGGGEGAVGGRGGKYKGKWEMGKGMVESEILKVVGAGIILGFHCHTIKY